MFKIFFCFLFSLWMIAFDVDGKMLLVKLDEDGYANDTANDKDLVEAIDSEDYRYEPNNTIPRQYVKIGGRTKLRCDSPKPIQGCKFKSPNGTIYNIGIGGGSSYEKSRIDCLCLEEEYDPTMACGIFIKDLSTQDTGEWSCLMEYKRNGRVTTKTARKYLHVGAYGGQEIEGDYVNDEGYVENTGEYIQKPEISLRPNNLIKVLPGLGSEYKIIFDLLITKVMSNRWQSILMFTADNGLRGHSKYGDRIPALYVWNKKLRIESSVSGNPNLHKDVPTTVGKWMKIEICQHRINNKLTYEIKINRKSVYKVEQKNPCLFKGVKVFAGQPWSAYQTVGGKIKNLYYETSDKENQGVCIVDFRPRPIGYPAKGEVLQGPELTLKKNQLLTVLPYIGREYSIKFELYLNSYPTVDWASVLHFTTQQNIDRYGDRNPAVWMSGHKDHYRLLHVSSSIDGNRNMWIDPRKIPPLKTWYKISISQTLVDNQFIYEVKVNGKSEIRMPNTVPSMFTNVKVYAGDPWYPAQDGKIRNLVLKTWDDGVCVCRAANCKRPKPW